MASFEYNPIENRFLEYEAVETPKVELNFPLFDNPIDISNYARSVSSEGYINLKPKLVRRIETEPRTEVDITQYTPDYKLSKNLKGNTKKAVDYFINKGLPLHQAAGIVANLYGESSLSHTNENPKSKAYGLAQWLGDRKKKLFAKYGKNPTFDNQLDFIWEELQSKGTPENRAFNALLNTKTLEDATDVFMRQYERPSEKEMNESIGRRVKFGKSILS